MPLAAGEILSDSVPSSIIARLGIEDAKVQRSLMLRATDWTQMPDSPLTAAERLAMSIYRQDLRDLPGRPGFPDVPWPVIPSLSSGTAGAVEAVPLADRNP